MPLMIPLALPGLADTSLYYAFRNSDVLGKGIVVVLFLFSMITWCIMADKGFGLKCALRDCAAFLEKFRSKRDPMTFADRIEEEPSPAARVCEAAYLRISQMNVTLPNGASRALSFEEIDIIRATMEQAVADQIIVLEGKMIFLATAVSISPFMGLFGTVWGIMLAFTELAIAGKADIQTLAPGVSGALLTTVAGLLVAIPSVIGYNVITSQIKSTIVHLDNFVEEFIVKLKIENIALKELQEQERKAQEQKDKDLLEKARQEQERLHQQEQARLERERRQLEQERQENERRRIEQERLEQERIRQQEQARLEQERIRQQEHARLEQERIRQQEQVRLEQERIRQQEQARLEQERLRKEEQARQEQERIRQQEQARLEQERLQKEEQARLQKEVQARLEQERLRQLEQARQESERKRFEQERLQQEQARLEQEFNLQNTVQPEPKEPEQPSLQQPDLTGIQNPNDTPWET